MAISKDWKFYGHGQIVAVIKSMLNIPDDLKPILDKFVEFYDRVSAVHREIQEKFFFEDGGCILSFDTDGDIVGELPLNLTVKMWSEGKITILEDEAMRYKATYRGPGGFLNDSICELWFSKQDLNVRALDVMEELLAPLREEGWDASVTRDGVMYHVEATIPYPTMMAS